MTPADTSSSSREPEAVSLGVRLLADLRAIFDRAGAHRVPTAELLRELHAIEDAPWADLYGKPLDARRLARELERYDVRPITFRTSTGTLKGYQTTGPTGLDDAWTRYLPAPEAVPSRNGRNIRNAAGQTPIPLDDAAGTSVTAGTPAAPTEDHVPDVTGTPEPAVPPLSRDVTDVPAVTAQNRPAALVQPSPAGALPAGAYGPCLDCGRLTHRYGTGGHGRCHTCRTGNVVPLHRPDRTEGTPA